MKLRFLSLVIGVASLSACSSSDCQREGCSALASPATGDGSSRVAGVIAAESDVVANGCQECTYGSASLKIWKSTELIDSAETAKALLGSALPTATFEANARYSQALAPGYYLLCTRPYCAAFEVRDKLVTTVNIKRIDGPAQFVVFDGGTATSHNVAAIEVGLQ